MPNRLAHETSPYLLQHAENPVEWFAWCDDAFEVAKATNRPIFLSIGYSSCHWCHVMEREVFENRELAALLNSCMVSIKVDREERPDIDRFYQEVFQVMNRRGGGWPLSIFLTPSLNPFFAATYIPPESMRGVTGFRELLEVIRGEWMRAPERLEESGAQVLQYVRSLHARGSGAGLNALSGVQERFVEQALSVYDQENGGFSQAPKFPSPSILEALLDMAETDPQGRAAGMVFHTLECMARGGLFDLVDGGFCRYSVDEKWLVPHFEKMTYDNALLVQCYVRAGEISDRPHFADIALKTTMFMLDKMHENGLFYSASDADSEGEEGRYFVCKRCEAMEGLITHGGFQKGEAGEILDVLSITEQGNFEGRSIPRLSDDAVREQEWYPRAIAALSVLRAQRVYPFVDRKIIVSWNAMMVEALFKLARHDERFMAHGTRTLQALLDKLFPQGELYHCAMPDTKPVIPAFLEDYAFLCRALITAYLVTDDKKWLGLADELSGQAVEKFYDNGQWFFSRGDFPVVSEAADGAYPSSLAVMLDGLEGLWRYLKKDYYPQIVRESLSAAAELVSEYPLGHATLVRVAMRVLDD